MERRQKCLNVWLLLLTSSESKFTPERRVVNSMRELVFIGKLKKSEQVSFGSKIKARVFEDASENPDYELFFPCAVPKLKLAPAGFSFQHVLSLLIHFLGYWVLVLIYLTYI